MEFNPPENSSNSIELQINENRVRIFLWISIVFLHFYDPFLPFGKYDSEMLFNWTQSDDYKSWKLVLLEISFNAFVGIPMVLYLG